jgi:hypothetical protein
MMPGAWTAMAGQHDDEPRGPDDGRADTEARTPPDARIRAEDPLALDPYSPIDPIPAGSGPWGL